MPSRSLPLHSMVDDGGVLGDAQRIVPGQDDGRGAEAHAGAHAAR